MKYNIGDMFINGTNGDGELFNGTIIGIEERGEGYFKYLVDWSDTEDGYFDEGLLDTIVGKMGMTYRPKENLPKELFEI